MTSFLKSIAGITATWLIFCLFPGGVSAQTGSPAETTPDTITVRFYDFDLFDYIEEYTESIRKLDYRQDSSYRIRNAENAGQVDSVFYLHNPISKAIVYESGEANELFLLFMESANPILLKKLWRSNDAYAFSFPGHKNYINKLVVESDDYELSVLYDSSGKLLKFHIISNFLE